MHFMLVTVPKTTPAPAQCTGSEWQCKNGDCIDRALRCNRVYDCVDGTDEFDCGRCLFKKGNIFFFLIILHAM